MSAHPPAASPAGVPPPASPGGLPRATPAQQTMIPAKFHKWIFRAIMLLAVVATALVIRWTFFDEKKSESSTASQATQSTSVNGGVVVSTPTVNSRTIVAAVACPSFAPEKQSCSFDHMPTAGFGSSVAGMSFCYDKPYGPEHSYSRERWDPSQRKWVPWLRNDQPGVVHEQRLMSNIPSTTVTVTYWLVPDGASCV